MKQAFLIASLLLIQMNAQAASTNLIALTSEAEPGKTAHLGVETDSNNNISEIFYKGADGKFSSFTLAELAKPQVLLTKKRYTIVSIKVPKSSAKTAVLSLIYTKNALTGDQETVRYTIRYNAAISRYEMLDEKQRQFDRAYVTTHRNMIGLAVGIDEIQTQ